jgi:Fe2+ transport system protein FeoA
MTTPSQDPRSTRLIADLPAGSHAIMYSLAGQHGFRSRMANLGFTAGAPVTVRQNYGRGPIVVALRGTLVALGRAEAARITVLLSEA